MKFNSRVELLRFLKEDIQSGDITSALLSNKRINARIISRQKAVIAGTKYAKEIFLIKKCQVKILKNDGDEVKPNQVILTINGTPQAILSCERTALNLLSRMSGIATQTRHLVRNLSSKKTKIFATRKTAPGLRYFDKEAVMIGGGGKHRMSLDEMVMIKDNHISVESSLLNLIRKAKKKYKKIEVEVENKNDAIIAAREGVSIIMLDNFSPRQISHTIDALKEEKLRDKVKLEASGGISSKNIASYAKTGVDIISIGSLTNAVTGIDFSLEV